jgi:carboxymethylenebutenolidase
MTCRTTSAIVSFAVVIALLTTALAPPAHAADTIPPDQDKAVDRLKDSPRHGEWAEIKVAGLDKPMRAFVAYPEVKEKAPVVIVIFEIFGMSDWIRSVGDQLAAEGFIAVCPDLLAGKGKDGGDTASLKGGEITAAVSGLKPDDVKVRLDAAHAYGKSLPSSNGKTATIGFCWGGGTSFRYATQQPDLAAAVVYYGTSPDGGYENIKCPVLGCYGEKDNRVDSTIPKAEEKMKELGKSYSPHIYEGAGHGFLRQQTGQGGANGKAAEAAWKETIRFLKENTK